MHPILFKIGKLTIASYGVLMSLAIVCALLLGLYRGEKRGFNTDYIIDIALYGIIGGLIGAKLLFFIAEMPTIFKDPSSIKYMIKEGFVVYGAIIGGAVSAYIYCRTKKISFIKHFDLLAPSIALGQGIGRIGCFCAGCCYGREAHNFPFAVTFKISDYAPNNVPLYPTQLMSSFGNFFIAAMLLVFASKKRDDGKIAGLYMILYSIGRFIIEFFRNDPRGSIGILSTSQFICIFVLIGGIIIYNFDRIIKSPASHD
ncbi:MAG: prolipoprotein diacylglyceryl transferase [Caloramator sp.]|nr:prolipoprotein diacylglyceryl transferase [Caloramator sp.]